ncbi:MAG: hypothetical protein QM725_02400 [Lacibacter sp.]
MKKIILSLVIAASAAFLFSSCAGSQKSYGCPTITKNKPFRA